LAKITAAVKVAREKAQSESGSQKWWMMVVPPKRVV
jgi:hypothetical protein